MTALALALLNACDAILSAVIFSRGLTTEVNPWLAFLWSRGTAQFIGIKLIVVSAACMVLWIHRNNRIASQSITTLSALYAAVVALEIAMLIGG